MSLTPASDASSSAPPRLLPRVLGHRGARHAETENTLEAFELARREGAAGTELDVQTSADGELFVVHDLDLKRVTEGRSTDVVHRSDSSRLSKIRLVGGRRIPRLEEVLRWARHHDMFLNIELKTASARRDRVAGAVAELLMRERVEPASVVVSSFHPLLLHRFHRRAPEIPTGWLFSAHHRFLAWPAWCKRLGCSAVHPQASALLRSPSLVERFAGLPINTWTVNDPAEARQLAALGVSALISDCPARIIRALHSD